MRYSPAGKKDRLHHLRFIHDREKDVVVCPRGKELPLRKADYVNRHENHFRHYGAKKSICRDCPEKGICNNSAKTGRSYYISHNEFQQAYRERTLTKPFKLNSTKRKGLIEHLFGTFRMWMGKVPILLTGKRKVRIEIDLYATAYNLRRLLNMGPTTLLLEKLQNYRFAGQ